VGNIKLVSSKGKSQKEYRAPKAQSVQKAQKVPNVRRRRTAAKTALIIILIIVVGIASLVFALGFYVRNLDTVFPNVWADGIDLSGMTMDEAVNALIAAGFENNADNVSATVRFPNDESFTITGNDVGFAFNAKEAAEAAFSVGRNGSSFLENDIRFVRSHIERTDLRDVSRSGFDDGLVREIVAEHTREFNLALIDAAYTIGDDSIIIEVGMGIMPAAAASVLALTVETLFRALEEQAHLTVTYYPAEGDIYSIDLQLLYDMISVEPVSAVYDRETFSATESSYGVSFDMEAAKAMLDNARRGEVVVIPLVVTEPELTTEELNSMLFRDVLGERMTRIAGNANRLNNIVVSAEFIHETKLNPGDVFSFNQIVGRRTRERGFREAGGFVSGRLVDVLGGGICQTSSTIYYAVLRANLEVLERQPHGMTVSYIPLGHDATIVWGQHDLRFRNNRDYPIKVEVVVEGREITARLLGTSVDDTFITTDFVILQTTPFEVITKEDPDVPPGRTIVDLDGSTGFVVEVFMNKFDGDGELIERWSIGRSTYRVQNRVILVPPETEYGEGTYETPSGETTPGAPPNEEVLDTPQDDIFDEPPAEYVPQDDIFTESPVEEPSVTSPEEPDSYEQAD